MKLNRKSKLLLSVYFVMAMFLAASQNAFSQLNTFNLFERPQSQKFALFGTESNEVYTNVSLKSGPNSAAMMACVTDPVVNSNGNSGPGTLRQAVIDACPGSTITFSACVVSPVSLTSGQIIIDKNLTVSGPGAQLMTIQNMAAAPTGTSRLFRIQSGITATITGLTINGGQTAGGFGVADGGGILNNGTLTITDSVVSNNSAPGNGGGGIANNNSLTVDRCTFSGNSSTFAGGGIGMINGGTLIIRNSTFTNNVAPESAAFGMQSLGTPGNLTVTNTTISGNLSSSIGNIELYANTGSITSTITSTTITNNTGSQTGGIKNFANAGRTSTLSIGNSIIAGNANTQVITGGAAVTTSAGYNILSDSSIAAGPGDQLNTNPLLAPLANNGGPTQTHAFQSPASPAIDKGNSLGTGADQRGLPRPFDGGAISNAADGSDVGAYELQGTNTAPSINAGAVITRQTGVPGITSQVATVGDSQASPGSLQVRALSVPAGLSISGIINSGGIVSANVSVCCGTATGNKVIVLEVTDGELTATTNLTVNVISFASATFGTYSNQFVTSGGGLSISPSVAPTLGGLAITASAGISPNSFTGSITVDPTTGTVAINNAGPSGVYTITVNFQDNCGGLAQRTFSLTVNAPPTLGNYGNTSVVFGQSTTVVPDAAPFDDFNNASIQVGISAGFTGSISINPLTGVVTINNAAPVSASSYTVTVTANDGYNPVVTKQFLLTVSKATLNINAVANTKVYGSVDPAFPSTLSGFQFSDNAGNSGITGAASCTRNAGETVAGGPYLITCTAGNLAAPNYAFVTGTTAGFTITKANATVVVTPYNVMYDGQPHTAAAMVTGVNGETGAAVGTVDLGNTTHTNAGTYANDTWTFTGGPNYNSIAATTITDKITTANTATSVTSSVNPVSTGQPVTFTAQVSAPGGGTPTGTVDFRDNNVTIPGCGAKDLSSLGAASCTTSSLTTGSHAITAVYSGDGNFNTSTGTLANAQVVDSPPTAVGTAADITSQGGTTQTVTVVYTDNNAVNVSTIDSNDIRITGPNGFDSAVTFVSVNQNTNGTPRTATYSFTAPGGTWDLTDNGTYTIVMQANQVSDLFPQPVAAGAIGQFTVSICNPQVTTLANAGAGSLREAVTNACNGSVITFAQNLNGTINLTAGEIAIPTNVTIQGPGANVITVSGNNTSRVFSIPPGLSVAINDLTVTGGRGDFGGGIFHLNAALSLRRVVVAGNTATTGSGGGVYNNAGTLTITDSTIASNTGGGVTNSGTLTITNSTVSGNTAGAGVANLAGAATLTSDTITNNTSGTTNAGGGSFTVRNTIIAGNTANTDAGGGYISNGYNLIGNASNSTGFNQTGDQAGSAASPINPLLSPLSSNGGPTPTHAFSSTLSPAIDKGRSFNLATDQRGSARPADFPTVSPAIGGDNSDIGAFEASVAAGGSGVDGDINRTSPASANSSDGVVDLKDLQWYDNFVNGTFIPDSGGAAQPLTVGPSTQENQRRDVAPTNIAGDGCLNAQDRQQMVLYALSLAAPGAAGGPSVLNQCPQVRPGGTVDSGQWTVDSRSSDSPMFSAEDRRRGAKIDPSVTRAVRVISSEVENGEMLVTIEMDAAGDETRGIFTLSFDPSAYSIDSTSFPSANPSISPGDEAPRGTTIAVNAAAASTGRITLLVDFNGAIPSGTEKRLVTLRFRIAEGTASTDITLNPETLQIINGSGSDLKVKLKRK